MLESEGLNSSDPNPENIEAPTQVHFSFAFFAHSRSLHNLHDDCFLSAISMQKLPLFLFGASSGGGFVGQLPAHLSVAGVIVQISATRVSPGYPPAVFMHMERDKRTSAFVKQLVTYLRKQGGQALDLVKEVTPLTPHFFSNNIDSIDIDTSEMIFKRLRKGGHPHGFLLERLGHLPGFYLTQDPRRSNWREALAEDPKLAGLPLKADESPISEMLNVAWAQHELYSDDVDKAIEFLLTCTTDTHIAAKPGGNGNITH